jgi:hypothetical protein
MEKGGRRGTLAFSEALRLQEPYYYKEMGPGFAGNQIRTWPIPGNHLDGAFELGDPNLPSAWGIFSGAGKSSVYYYGILSII